MAESDATDDPPEMREFLEYPQNQREDDRRWIVLFEEDYDDVAIDVEDNVALLVDIEQTGEILRLASQTLASLSYRDAEPEDPIRDMIAGLERQLDEMGDVDE